MSKSKPKPFKQWRTTSADREEDAAHVFGFDLMRHCRTEVLDKTDFTSLPKNTDEFRSQVTQAVDSALHNVMALLEGFWPIQAGPRHKVEYVLSVRVRDHKNTVVESVDISPCLIDLPIGYWKWKDGEFR